MLIPLPHGRGSEPRVPASGFTRSLEPYNYGLPRVPNLFRDAAVRTIHHDDAKDLLAGHTRIVALPSANRQGRGFVVPPQGNDRTRAFLISVGVALVIVKGEAAVAAAVHSQLGRFLGALFRVLDLRPKRQNRSSPDVQRDAIQRRFGY